VDAMDDDEIRALVKRLARPHPSGGDVIERSVILAEGSDCTKVIEWITAHAGAPEALAAAPGRGLHGPRLGGGQGAEHRAPLRYVLPAGALT
jgi:hypothetical protein